VKDLKIYGTIKNGGLDLPPNSRMQLDGFLKSMPDGLVMEIEYRKLKAHKTYQQCKTFFGLLAKTIADELNERGWTFKVVVGDIEARVRPTVGRVKDLLYDLFASKDEDGNIITISHMDIDKMRDFYQDCVDGMAAEPWYIYIPDPDPEWATKKGGSENK
jgi:hypothetical protein